jgi:hypothetical protein
MLRVPGVCKRPGGARAAGAPRHRGQHRAHRRIHVREAGALLFFNYYFFPVLVVILSSFYFFFVFFACMRALDTRPALSRDLQPADHREAFG